MVASVEPTFNQPPGVVAFAPNATLPTLVTVPVVVKSVPPILSLQVVAALNTVVVTTLTSTICAPAGTVTEQSKEIGKHLGISDEDRKKYGKKAQ